MKQPKPATKPKAQVREVFEILPLEWIEDDDKSSVYTIIGTIDVRDDTEFYEAYQPGHKVWSMYYESDGEYVIHGCPFGDRELKKQEAEQWYRQQLGKALRRVES